MASRKKRTPMVRKFNGKGYAKTLTYDTKARAKKSADGTRKAGNMARIVKGESGYTVYIRLKK